MNARMTRVAGAVSIAFGMGLAAPLHASMIQLVDGEGQDSGWEASWDDSLDPYVDITVDDVIFGSNAVYITKVAEFTQGPVNGLFPSIIIMFRQVSVNAVENIIVSEEFVTNSTGRDWSDFHILVTGGNDVAFNEANSSDFSVDPFTVATFSDSRHLDISGGIVADGETWEPGTAGVGDDLWIQATLRETEPLTTFFLKERPTPEPATLALLGLGASVALRRRRQF